MPNSLTLTTIGILSVAGAALGVHLGRASVSEINPIYFQEPPVRFHSDLGPYRSQAAASYAARPDLGSRMELGTGCIGCRTYPEEYVPQRESIVDEAIEGMADEQPALQLAAVGEAAETDLLERDADLERLQRYARFAVSEEEGAPAQSRSIENEASAIQGDEVASAE